MVNPFSDIDQKFNNLQYLLILAMGVLALILALNVANNSKIYYIASIVIYILFALGIKSKKKDLYWKIVLSILFLQIFGFLFFGPRNTNVLLSITSSLIIVAWFKSRYIKKSKK